MTKKLIVVIASARQESDTRKHLEKVFSDVDYELLDLLNVEICHYNYQGAYLDSDKFLAVIEKLVTYDTIVFATPVYWYAMSGLMKIFFDRLTDLVTTNKLTGRNLKGKKTFLFAVGSDELLPTGFTIPFEMTSKYFGMNFIDSIYISTKGIESDKAIISRTKEFVENIKRNNS